MEKDMDHLLNKWEEYSNFIKEERKRIHMENLEKYPLMKKVEKKFLWFKYDRFDDYNLNILMHCKLPDRSIEGFLDWLYKNKV